MEVAIRPILAGYDAHVLPVTLSSLSSSPREKKEGGTCSSRVKLDFDLSFPFNLDP